MSFVAWKGLGLVSVAVQLFMWADANKAIP